MYEIVVTTTDIFKKMAVASTSSIGHLYFGLLPSHWYL